MNLCDKVAGKLKRHEQLIYDVPLNSLLINCRSVKKKLKSLVDNIQTNDSTLAILTETWLYRNDKQVKKELREIFDEHGLSIIRKDRNSRGGGVAIVYNSRVCELKKIQLRSLKGNSAFEILAAVGKIRGTERQIAVVACYVPPNYKKEENNKFMELLSDTISEVKTKSNGAWLTLGGDFNRRELDSVTDLFPDLNKVISPSPHKKGCYSGCVLYQLYRPYKIGNSRSPASG